MGKQGTTFEMYMSLSLHDRWWLHQAVASHLERFYGGGAGLMPEE